MNSEARWQRWEETKQRGLLRFVLVAGMLAWGVMVGTIYSLAMHFLRPAFPLGMLPFCIAWFAFGGILWALAVWFYTDWKYARYLKRRGPKSTPK
jgi:hypothetical protein